MGDADVVHRWRRSAQIYGVGLAIVAAGCSDPPATALGDSTSSSGSSSGTTSTTTADTTTTAADTTAADGGSTSGSTTSGTESTEDGASSESSSTGEPPRPNCGDDQVAMGELCHTLGPPIDVVPAPVRLASGDLDDDGINDIVLADPAAPPLVVLFGVGDGNLVAPQALFDAGAAVHDLAMGDISGDGVPDVVVTDNAGSRVVSFANDGSGGFFFAGQYPANLLPLQLHMGDINGDLIPDVVITGTNTAQVMLGNGLAGFLAQQLLSVPNGPHAAGMLDVNLDGQTDVLTVNQGGGNTTCFLNQGDMLAEGVDHDTANTPIDLALGDVDEDGTTDVLVVHPNGNVGVLLGDGMGTLGSETLLPVDSDSRALALADLDLDGHLDLVTAHTMPGLVVIHRGAGDGTFVAGPSFEVGGPSVLHLTELNGDGVPDLVIGRRTDSIVQALLSAP